LATANPTNGYRHFEEKTYAGFGSRFKGYEFAWQNGYFAIVRDGGWQSGARRLAKFYDVKLIDSIYLAPALNMIRGGFMSWLNTY
jgi:hypothetical protein